MFVVVADVFPRENEFFEALFEEADFPCVSAGSICTVGLHCGFGVPAGLFRQKFNSTGKSTLSMTRCSKKKEGESTQANWGWC